MRGSDGIDRLKAQRVAGFQLLVVDQKQRIAGAGGSLFADTQDDIEGAVQAGVTFDALVVERGDLN